MTIDDAAAKLTTMYASGSANSQKALQVHLFAIKYAEQLESMSLPDVVERAGLPASYKTELRKGMNLAAYVQLRT